MNDVYAFLRGKAEEMDKFMEGRPANVKSQTLKEHVDNALRALEDVKRSKIWRYAVKIFEGDKGLVDKCLRAIVLFHDIGKVFYQANVCLDREKNIKYLNFKGHEYFSAYLADEYLWSEESELDEHGRQLILSTILYHHHAMGLKERGRVRELRVCRTKEDYDAMCDAIGELLTSHGLRAEALLNRLRSLRDGLEYRDYALVLKRKLVNEVYREVEEVNKKTWELFVGDGGFRRRMLISTVILQVCDYKGSEGRTRKPPRFYGVLKEFVEMYRV